MSTEENRAERSYAQEESTGAADSQARQVADKPRQVLRENLTALVDQQACRGI